MLISTLLPLVLFAPAVFPQFLHARYPDYEASLYPRDASPHAEPDFDDTFLSTRDLDTHPFSILHARANDGSKTQQPNKIVRIPDKALVGDLVLHHQRQEAKAADQRFNTGMEIAEDNCNLAWQHCAAKHQAAQDGNLHQQIAHEAAQEGARRLLDHYLDQAAQDAEVRDAALANVDKMEAAGLGRMQRRAVGWELEWE